MSKEEFKAFLEKPRSRVIYVEPYEIVECRCGDVNCHGWRLVPRLQ